MSNTFNRVSVIGLGYIGLPTAAMFASRKVHVIGVDVNQHAVDTINQGKIHIVEPGLDIAVHASVTSGYLKATTTPEPADAFIIAVPTPFKDDHKPDLACIEAASKAIAPVLQQGNLIILESTSPVGATEKMAEWLAQARPDLSFPQQNGEQADINISHCPERVLPGHIMCELIKNDRIIGGLTPKCAQRSAELYNVFVEGQCIATNARTAEMTKLTENSFRDVNIAFANELSMICDKLDINVWELIQLANRHPRVNILQPGCGVGGHCIAVDPWFIVDSAPDEAKLIHTARQVNDYKPEWVVEKIIESARKNNTQEIVCMGLAFKPDIDDLRESPALEVVTALAEQGFQIKIVEPNISDLPTVLTRFNCTLLNLEDIDKLNSAIQVLLVAHSQFKSWFKPQNSHISSIMNFCGMTK